MLTAKYIGIDGGYLKGFSYRTHAEFYPLQCGLDIDVRALRGPRDITTRYLFEEILEKCEPHEQAKILRGVLVQFPPDGDEERTKLKPLVDAWIARLEGAAIPVPPIQFTYESARTAMTQAEKSIADGDPISAIDRSHTALHGYVKQKCIQEGIAVGATDSLTMLFRQLKQRGVLGQEIVQIVNSLGSIVHELNELRNQKSIAHPNQALLSENEAHLAVNSARTVLRYLHGKLG
jgi:HEPN domain-containing protein